MNRFSKIYKTISVLIVALPFVAFAQFSDAVCSSNGYTIETINGIFTDKVGARDNKVALQKYFPSTYNGEPLTIDFLLNKTHSILDVTDTAIQKTFEGVNMWDPDFIKMLSDASAQVKTQKLLLVSHSQGNFYANNVYKVVTDSGDVSKKSIGVYGVASPASYVAGGGRHLTSSTDKVIAFLVENVLPGKIAPVNDTIDYKWADDSGKGHGFSEIYLKYRPAEIAEDIKWSLDKLSLDPTRSENGPCINPPKELSTLVKIVQPAVYATATVLVSGVATATTIKNTAVGTAVGTYHFAVATAVWSYNTTVAVAVWSYNTTTAVAKFVGNATVAVASTVYNAVAGVLSGTAVAGNNSAAVILATQSVQNLPSVSVDNKTSISPSVPIANDQPAPIVPPQLQPQEVFVFEPKVQGDTSVPKLVFVGSFLGGGGALPVAAPQVLGTQSTAQVIDEVVAVGGGGDAGAALAAPALSAPQCTQTLATDGCLLATTTVRFEWVAVSGASYYATIKNGAYSTTTETALDISVRDFSDYTFEVVAVGTDGTASATSTQAVSVATIPIAINEIAWMGTVASANDEWFEIKNNTTHTIDLAQWELDAKDGAPHVVLAGMIAPRAYLIFERKDDTVVSDVSAHATTTGALNNGGDRLTLIRDSVIFDQTPDGAWAAGYNSTTTRKTMERYSSREFGIDPANWGTNLGYIKNGTDAGGNAINGTPGAQNSVSTLINKGEDITDDFTLTDAEERYMVTSDGVWVYASTTLTIEPGVTVSFYSNAGDFFIQGAVDAEGTAENPIVFNSFSGAQEGGFWIDDATATSTFDHALFENTGSIVVSGSDIEIRNSDFVHTDGALEAYEGATVLIKNTHFASSTSDTIGIYENSAVRIASSTIENQLDDDAIGVYEGSSLVMSSTTIDGVHDGSGIYAYDAFVSVASSTIKNVDDSGILLSSSTSTISNTVIENAGWTGIDIYKGAATITDTTVSGVDGWAGISVDAPVEPVVVSGGEVFGNELFGVSMYLAGAAVISETSSVHDNGENVVVW